MKPTNLFALLLILTTALLPMSCNHLPEKPTRFWDTGNATADSLLTLIDYYEYQYTLTGNRGQIDSLLSVVSAMNETPAAALLAQSWRRTYNHDTCINELLHLDSMALAHTDTIKSPYLAARIKFELAQGLGSSELQSETYFDLVDCFSNVRDSLRLVYTLLGLKIAYSHIFDDSTQIECLRETKRVIPYTLPIIHDFVDFSILMMSRKSSSKEYKALLDSIRLNRRPFNDVVEIGTVVYTESYRVTGNEAYMDTAAMYYSQLPNKTDLNAMIFKIYQLRLFDERGLVDSARVRCNEMEAMLDNGKFFNLELARELTRHYHHIGDEVAATRTYNRLQTDSMTAAAMMKVNNMSRIKASKEMNRLKQILHRKGPVSNDHKWLWFSAGIIVIIMIAGISIYRYRRKSRRQPAQPEETPTDNADREMVAAHLVSATNDTEEKSTALGGFDIAFSRVRPGFTDELLALHPKLTAYELRLCSLLSIGLDTKEIARILSINPDSVKKSRQRLRAKLGIPSDMTFIEYFRNLPQ